MSKAASRLDRRTHNERVPIDRRKGDEDLAERMIRGVRASMRFIDRAEDAPVRRSRKGK